MKGEIKLLNFDDIKQESEDKVVITRRRKTEEELERERILRIQSENHTYNKTVDKYIMSKYSKRK